MKDFAFYSDAGQYPDKNDFTTYYVYDSGKTMFSGSPAEFRNYCEEHGIPKTYEKVIDDNAWKAARTAYNDRSNVLEHQFKLDLIAEFGLTNNPKAEKCFALAWNYGHSAGYSEVYNYFSELVELIK